MQEVLFRTFLNDAGEAVLQMELDGKPMVHQLQDESGLSALIDQLAALRASMAEEVPRELDPGARLVAVTDPVWRSQDSKTPGFAKLLALRHPGLGWLTFLLPEKEARALAEFLLKGLPTEQQ